VNAKCVILRVWKVLPLGMLLLQGQDGQTWKDHVRNYAPCHLPHVNGQIDPSLANVLVGLWYMLCGQSSRTTIMLICDQCSQGWHMGCFMPLVEEMSVGKWFCPQCRASPSLGGTNRNVTPWFSWTHRTLKNHKKHLNEHFYNFF
jgi:hypothetical protein